MAKDVVSVGPFGGAASRLLVHGDHFAGKVRAHCVVALQSLDLASHRVATTHVGLVAVVVGPEKVEEGELISGGCQLRQE